MPHETICCSLLFTTVLSSSIRQSLSSVIDQSLQVLCCVESSGAGFLPLCREFRISFSSPRRYDQPTIDKKIAPTTRLIRARDSPSRLATRPVATAQTTTARHSNPTNAHTTSQSKGSINAVHSRQLIVKGQEPAATHKWLVASRQLLATCNSAPESRILNPKS
jgi:hypothetical protein